MVRTEYFRYQTWGDLQSANDRIISASPMSRVFNNVKRVSPLGIPALWSYRVEVFPIRNQDSLICFCGVTYYSQEWQAMDLSKVLEQLRRELVHLDAAIASLERLQAKAVRRGRPPRMLVELRKTHAAPEPAGARRARRVSPIN
jgi:hypothetical protein